MAGNSLYFCRWALYWTCGWRWMNSIQFILILYSAVLNSHKLHNLKHVRFIRRKLKTASCSDKIEKNRTWRRQRRKETIKIIIKVLSDPFGQPVTVQLIPTCILTLGCAVHPQTLAVSQQRTNHFTNTEGTIKGILSKLCQGTCT